MRKTLPAAALAAAALALPAAAQAHVTVHPSTLPAGSADTLISIRVPNEMDNADVVKVDVQMPPGFAEASFQPVPGWTAQVTKAKLPTPIKTDDGTITEGVSRITWTGGRIPPGGFQDFNLSVLVPDKPGQTLTFKALQTYSDGMIVRWIGPPGSANPAATAQIAAPVGTGATAPAAAATPAATPAKSDDSAGNGLAIAALIVGALGLATGVFALLAARRRARV